MKSRIFILAVLATVHLAHSAAVIREGGESSQITITKLGGGSHQIDFNEADTVGQLKAKISLIDGTPASSLILVFAGKQLDDSKLLTDYGIQRDSKVIFLQRPVKRPEQQQQQQRVESRPSTDERQSSSNTGDVRPAIENLFVRTSSGEIFEVPADAELTVGQFKLVVGLLINAPADTIHLEFNGVPLVDQKSLYESGLRNEFAVNMTVNQAALQAQSAVFERVVGRVVASLVKQLNNNGQPRTKFLFKHDPNFTETGRVLGVLNERIMSEFKRTEGQTSLILYAYRSKDLRVEFGYEFRGVRTSKLANLNDGAQWVAEQAKAAAAIEAKEIDQSETEILGDFSPTTPGPLRGCPF